MKRNFQKLIANLDADELREELSELYDRFELVRKYYSVELSGDTSKVVDKYKKQLHKLFLPTRGKGKRARSQSAALLKEFSNISVFPEDLIELHYYRTELMIAHIKRFRVDNDGYHASMVSSYRAAAKMASKALLGERFKPESERLAKVFWQQSKKKDFRQKLWDIFDEVWENK